MQKHIDRRKQYVISLLVIVLSAVIVVEASAFTPSQLFTTVAYISGQKKTKMIELGGKKYEVWLKGETDTKFFPLRDSIHGTGFFIMKNNSMYLVTADHVIKDMEYNIKIVVLGSDGNPVLFDLKSVADNTVFPGWTSHREGDVATIKLVKQSTLYSLIKAINFNDLLKGQHFDESRPLTTIGFPLDFGLKGKFSPIHRTSRMASGLFRYKRFDRKEIESNFIILDDPSVEGFSGAPVYAQSSNPIGGANFNAGPFFCVGIIHGTVSDNTGGKFAAMTPASYISELIDMIK